MYDWIGYRYHDCLPPPPLLQWYKLSPTTPQQHSQWSKTIWLTNCKGKASRLKKMRGRFSSTVRRLHTCVLRSRNSAPGTTTKEAVICSNMHALRCLAVFVGCKSILYDRASKNSFFMQDWLGSFVSMRVHSVPEWLLVNIFILSLFLFPHSAKIFQKTKCSMCNSPLELPSVHFLCSHSFHQHCFESYAESEAECPTCTPENRKVMDMLRAQEQKRDLHDHFNRQVLWINVQQIAQYVMPNILCGSGFQK